MHLDLSSIMDRPGESLSYSVSVDLSDLVHGTSNPVCEPVLASGAVRNTAGVLVMKGLITTCIHGTCDRCAAEFRRNVEIPIDVVLVTELANEENEYVMPAYIANGKEYIYYGAGLEYFPLKENKGIRIHAAWASNNYTKRHMINVGLTWKFDVVGAIRFLANEAK